jgi:hypothetical protein
MYVRKDSGLRLLDQLDVNPDLGVTPRRRPRMPFAINVFLLLKEVGPRVRSIFVGLTISRKVHEPKYCRRLVEAK